MHLSMDTVPHEPHDIRLSLKKKWDAWDWRDFFDAIEFLYQLLSQLPGYSRDKWFERGNEILEREGCAYRFISRELAPITNPTEIQAIQLAADSAIVSVGTHIVEALRLLPPNPDSSPRNSIKESISAVEAALKHLTSKPGLTFGKALVEFERQYGALNDSFRRGLDGLYAYTNNPGGMRHALVDSAIESTVDEARFMVVTCSAFANYLIAIAARKSVTPS